MPRGGQVGNKNGFRHGYYSLFALRKGGKKDLRRRFWRAFEERKQEYVSALGEDVSPQELTLIEDTVWMDFYVAAFDGYLAQRNIVRKGRPHPCFDTRTKLAAHRRENIKLFGLYRRAKDIPDLAQELAKLNKPSTAQEGGITKADERSCFK